MKATIITWGELRQDDRFLYSPANYGMARVVTFRQASWVTDRVLRIDFTNGRDGFFTKPADGLVARVDG